MNAYLSEIKESYQDFSKSEKRLADFFIQNPEEARGKTIIEVSERVGVSKATIVRFAKTLGYSGYRDFILRFSIYPNGINNEDKYIPNFLEVAPGERV